MYTFGQLYIGDMFNTKAARWVKTSSHCAVCVMSGCIGVGKEHPFAEIVEVVLLWSSLLSDDPACANRKPEQPRLSESEKEDRFYRTIEAEIDAENREREAAEFKQSLIDERDALIARRTSLIHYRLSLDASNPVCAWIHEQNTAMARYIVALEQRLALLDQSANQTV